MPVLPVETSAEWARAAILLGSNHESRRNLRHAVALLARFGRIVAVSPVYQSEDVAAAGTIARAPYLNAALVLETTLSAAELKFQALRPLEAELGRLRDLAGASDPAAPVPIDLDLALYDDLVIDDPALGLRLPHPDILLHRHAAQPLADILPDWRHPVDGR
ncbi:MAG TPA: 2-amino-4-hydroxy-6-hydroxymethyldihydropteridine diphosphokinase, partial [Anaerolineae bacterium]|nr:2-amino-4-hydroxy-6-hydroxymethyldihydropteridine diphosphokinase [Anaerolineae bacterium]